MNTERRWVHLWFKRHTLTPLDPPRTMRVAWEDLGDGGDFDWRDCVVMRPAMLRREAGYWIDHQDTKLAGTAVVLASLCLGGGSALSWIR